jgi:hypothetical protein
MPVEFLRSWLTHITPLILFLGIVANLVADEPPQSLGPASTSDQILDALHAVGLGLKDFTADVSLAEIDALNGDKTTLSGKVWYQSRAAGDSRIRVLFDKKENAEKKPVKDFKIEYLLDAGKLTDRDYKRKIEVQRDVLKPGQKMNLLKLGEGPFPLPIGQERADVLLNFEVKKIDAKNDDPPATVHLQLTPKKASPAGLDKKFKTIDVWVETRTGFPRRIETVDKRETETRSTDLTNIRVNGNVQDREFVLEKVENWRLTNESLQ